MVSVNRFLTAPWHQSQVNRNMPSMCYCKVPNKRGQMVTVKSVFANCRLFNGRSAVLIRGLSTSVEVDMGSEQEVPPEKKWATTGRKNQTTLYQRLSALGWKKGCVAQTINAYIREGKAARKDVLETCIKELRRYKKHHLALEILEWMEKRKMNFGFGDHARRLDLTAKVHGIAAAENYFDGLSPSQKNNNATYGALLNCYCNEKMADKACDIFKKMDEIGKTSLSFNNIMSLYMRLGQPEKVPPLVQSMKEREIRLSTFTYNIWMKSYSSMNDIQGVERVFEEIKTNNETLCDWTTYSNLAMAYVKAGLNEKAELALKQCELKMKARPHDPEGYSWLITLYAKTLNHDEVHRVWKSLKSNVRVVSNLNYLTMIQALFKLNDVDGMKKCFEEWESTCSYYDTRLVNAVLDGYIKHHMIEEAKTTIRRAHERSNGPFFIAWEKLMAYGLNTGKTELALECLKAAIGDGGGGCEWYPRFENVSKFFSCFKQEKDVDGAEKLCEYLKKLKPLDSDVYEMLLQTLQTYIAAGRSTATDDIRKRIEEDGVELTTMELQNLLETVCP